MDTNNTYSRAAVLPLCPGEAHLWYSWTEQCCTPERQAYYYSLLSTDEHRRLERFAFNHSKREYLLTRALCRLSLSRYVNVPPSEWRFRSNPHGRPEIDTPEISMSLRFNLSNTHSLVACVVTCDIDAGVDVEETNRDNETINIADRYFSRAEVDALRNLPFSQQRQRFFELWVLKESYIKARGMGLSIPLDQFSFDLDNPASIRISFDPTLVDVPEYWQFQLFSPSQNHRMAVSLCRGNSADWRIRLLETIPGADPS